MVPEVKDRFWRFLCHMMASNLLEERECLIKLTTSNLDHNSGEYRYLHFGGEEFEVQREDCNEQS